jgi:tetratricopeptide (TPR) repeat protein
MMCTSRYMRPFFAAAIWLALCGFGMQAFAQEDAEESNYTEPSDNQVDLNANAVEAMGEDDYERAVRLLEASIDLGELNVTWLNLGRAYHRLGRCKEARNAYLAVVSAPPVREPSPRLVDAKAEQYLEELEETCETDDVGPEPDELADQEPTDDEPAAQPAPEGSNTLGWAAMISGGTLMATGGVFYLLARSEHGAVIDALDDSNQSSGVVVDMSQREAIERRERGDLFDTMALSTAVVGTAVAGVGAYLIFSEDASTEVSVGAGPEGWTVGFSSRF